MAALNQALLTPSRSYAAKGLWPREHEIAKGTVLYRFVDTTRAADRVGADGPWWFEYEHFQTIKHFAERHGHSLGYAARLFAAILYEWSEVNAVVRAEAVGALAVWKGRGKQVVVGQNRPLYHPEIDERDNNRTQAGLVTGSAHPAVSKMTPMQGPLEVYQLYIPGLGPPHFGLSRYLKFLGSVAIQTG